MRRAGVFNDVLQFLSLLYATRHKSGGSPTHRETLDEAAKDGRNGHRSSASGEGGAWFRRSHVSFFLYASSSRSLSRAEKNKLLAQETFIVMRVFPEEARKTPKISYFHCMSKDDSSHSSTT